MGKKKQKHEEHINLERYLISYADFITLLFATFVVLYALARMDISEFEKLQESMKKAFAAPSLMQGSDGLMENSGDSILSSTDAGNAAVPPILEYLSAKYEDSAFNAIRESLENMDKSGDIEGVDVTINDRGLIIDIPDVELFFGAGNAQLTPKAKEMLIKVGKIIKDKFSNHAIRVEGHTDDLPISSTIYPSNWELSSARASVVVRFLIEKFKFKQDLFSAIGYADTRPKYSNKTKDGRAKNRRVSIVILRNKHANSEPKVAKDIVPKPPVENQSLITKQNNNDTKPQMSDAAKKLLNKDYNPNNVLIIRDSYDRETAQLARELENKEQKYKNTMNVVSGSNISNAAKELIKEQSYNPKVTEENTTIKPENPEYKENTTKRKPVKETSNRDIIEKIYNKIMSLQLNVPN